MSSHRMPMASSWHVDGFSLSLSLSHRMLIASPLVRCECMRHSHPVYADVLSVIGCQVIPIDGRKQLLPPLGRRDFCRPAKLGPLQVKAPDGH